MELSLITEDPHVARRAFLDYRAQVRQPLLEQATAAERELREIDREMLRAYRELAKGTTLIRLDETILAGGHVEQKGRWDRLVTLPRLAVASATSRNVWTPGVTSGGRVLFSWERTPRRNELSTAAGKSVTVQAFAPDQDRRTWWNEQYRATVPTVPPEFRPPKLSGYHVLFEATWQSAPAPADPALIRHVGGDLWAVLATWDLTPLEAAVLGHRRR